MKYQQELRTQLQTRFSRQEIIEQITVTWKTVGIGVLYLLLITGFIVLTARFLNKPTWMFTRDPAEVRQFPAYIGMLSNIGNMLWMMTAAICFLGANLIERNRADQITYQFLCTSGLLSIILGIDDLFLLHDQVFPDRLHIPEGVFYLLYIIAILFYLVYFLPSILKNEYLLLGISIFFLGLSRSPFISQSFLDQYNTGVDFLKHFGIVFWLIFFLRTTLQEINALIGKSDIHNP